MLHLAHVRHREDLEHVQEDLESLDAFETPINAASMKRLPLEQLERKIGSAIRQCSSVAGSYGAGMGNHVRNVAARYEPGTRGRDPGELGVHHPDDSQRAAALCSIGAGDAVGAEFLPELPFARRKGVG